ncbi:serine 3-dehydrogenase [Moniliophthora roreri MCA 2997]|uniref:Serine 3-dehydrogenase n=1 Tax=Moniliophthora roreri (strain MCA 2997) TaxID=1381753 RepID=V2XM14_MONRO|nr:serine 3-dehydrogenase [Moniliophthora roreri MCA 2997]
MFPSLVWLITGTSTGLGRELTLAALRRGDKVIATARVRSLSQIDDLKEKGAATLELDVTAPLEDLQAVAKKAVAIYGQVDIVVNNAGYILVGAIEENTPQESFDQFNTNVFGAINVTRAFLPYMRERKTGTIIFSGSVGGWRGCPAVGLYAATKWTLRGVSASLHDEIAPLGLRSICIDFGYFRTAFLNPDHRKPYIPRIQDYNEVTGEYEAALQAYNNKQPGDPLRGVEIMVDIVRGEGVAKGKTFSNNIQLGSDCYETVKTECEEALRQLEEWKDVSFSTDFPKGT